MKKRIEIIDFLRGYAAFGVLLFHYNFKNYNLFNNFHLNVDLFFVISGLVLYKQIKKIKNKKQLIIFLKKRILRLFPLAIFILVVKLILQFINIIFINKSEETIYYYESENFLFNLILCLMLLQIFSKSAILIFIPMWSLSAEWIASVFISCSKVIWPRMKLISIIMIVIGYLLFIINSIQMGQFNSSDEYFTTLIGLGRCFIGFGIGLFLAATMESEKKKFIKKERYIILIIIIIYFYVFFTPMNSFKFSFISILYGITLFCILRIKISNKLFQNIAVVFGNYSYGIYLWHTLILSVNQNLFINSIAEEMKFYTINLNIFIYLISILMTFIAALLTYHLIEKPFMRLSYNQR